MLPDFIDRTQLPHKPGIYIYRSAANEIIYVGKAIDLQKRVSSYFSKSPDSLKTAHLVSEIRSVETVVVESELEALILEANLIKKYLPKFNIRLTDDKDYLYIKITKEAFPRVLTARKADLADAKKYFGPFPSSRTVKDTLRRLRRIFPWCQNPPKDETESKKLRPCFYYHLGLCPGPCAGVISKYHYNQIIRQLSLLLDGKKDQLTSDLLNQMTEAASLQEFEKATSVKKILSGIQYLTQPNRTTAYLENPNFLEDQNTKALEELQKALNLPELPVRIEGYDISNTQGTNSTGSMVVLTNGEVDKSQYRKFKIHPPAEGLAKPNDYAMHQEVMRRRLKHSEWPLPQLFLIDGGRGQVRASQAELLKHGLNIPIYGLAKREELLYPPEGEVVKLPKRFLSLRLLQKLRDEAHRFAITYHRKLRSRSSGFGR